MLERLDSHHVVPLQRLKRERVPEEAWYDSRNQLTLCRYHHGRHESAMQRVPLHLLSETHREFAREHELEHVLTRYYAL